MGTGARSIRGNIVYCALNLTVAVIVLLAVFVGLPLRYWPVDAGAVMLALALLLASVCQWLSHRTARLLHRAALLLVLGLGLVAILALASAIGALEGVHGPLADGTRLIVLLVAALLVPYTIVLPGVQLTRGTGEP